MREAYGVAANKSKERKAICKSGRDKRAYLGPLHTSDSVLLVRKFTECGDTGKLRSCWENDIYKIVDCKGEDSFVLEVQPEKRQDGKQKRVLHRNMFLPCGIILEEQEGFHLEKERQKKTKQLASNRFANNTSGAESSEDEVQGLRPIQEYGKSMQ